jgi:hypothetical protein
MTFSLLPVCPVAEQSAAQEAVQEAVLRAMPQTSLL